AEADAEVRDRVAWARDDLAATPPPAGAFDLVSMHYFPLRREPDHRALCGLLAAVAPGGTLLYATHPLPAPGPGPNTAAEYYQPGDIAQLLGPAWGIVVNETRPRTTPPPEGTHHTHDAVLRALRLS
ncbi:SAM-dependent methyltransferase, partial [Streptomyces varsoviensis]